MCDVYGDLYKYIVMVITIGLENRRLNLHADLKKIREPYLCSRDNLEMYGFLFLKIFCFTFKMLKTSDYYYFN